MTIKPAYGRAALQPLAIAVLLAALLFGLTVALWLLPLGVLVYGVLVFLGARDPALQLAEPPRPRRATSPTFKAYLDTIERTQQEIGRSAVQAGGPLARLLLPVSDQARDLVHEAYVLADKGQIIERYLASIDRQKLVSQMQQVERQLNGTQDPYTRQQLSETRQALLDQQTDLRDLETYIGRISAQLQNISASLDNVLADTVRLRTADAASASAATDSVAERLMNLKSDMHAFQRVLDTAMSHAGAV